MIAPSRKIIAIGIICTALLGSVAYVQFAPERENAAGNGILTTIELPELNVPITVSEDTRDSDNDGLKDWQEVIVGTDSNNPDTDGDGTLDGAETTNTTTELTVGSTDIYSAYVPRSLTDNVSKNLFSTYIQTKSNGGITSEDLTEIGNSIANEALSGNDLTVKYTSSAIGTFSDSDTEAGTRYGEVFGTYYLQALVDINNGSEDLVEIAPIYAQLSKDLAAMFVPASLRSVQADIANNFYNTAVMFSVIGAYDTDPIKAALALRSLKTLVEEQGQLLTAAANYFRRNGIIFESEEIQALWQNI